MRRRALPPSRVPRAVGTMSMLPATSIGLAALRPPRGRSSWSNPPGHCFRTTLPCPRVIVADSMIGPSSQGPRRCLPAQGEGTCLSGHARVGPRPGSSGPRGTCELWPLPTSLPTGSVAAGLDLRRSNQRASTSCSIGCRTRDWSVASASAPSPVNAGHDDGCTGRPSLERERCARARRLRRRWLRRGEAPYPRGPSRPLKSAEGRRELTCAQIRVHTCASMLLGFGSQPA